MTKTQKRIEFARMIGRLLVFSADQGIEVMPFYYHRTAEEQAVLVKAGKSQVARSKHQDWLAMDLVIVQDGVLRWDSVPEYATLGSKWESLGGVWGGRWKSLVDIYHFEFAK